MRRLIYFLCIALLAAACSESIANSELAYSETGANIEGTGESTFLNNESASTPGIASGNEVALNDIRYRFNVLTALDYLKQKGEQPSEQDISALKKEFVAILEIETLEAIKDVFSSEKLKMNKEDVIKYLMGEISADIELLQDDKEFAPTGVQYDGMLTGANKFRLFLFFKDLNVERTVVLKYYDRLFGAGLINLKQHEINSI